MMGFVASALGAILGAVSLPQDVLERPGEFLLHLSDTPSSFFPDVARMIKQINPSWIVHTGDLVDQIKLGICPGRIGEYRHKLAGLSHILDGGAKEGRFEAVIALGNHDDPESVREFFPHCHIIDKVGSFTVGPWSFVASHYSRLIEAADNEVALWGHDLSRPDGLSTGLNGLASVNLFSLGTGGVYRIPYPSRIDDERQLKRHTGL